MGGFLAHTSLSRQTSDRSAVVVSTQRRHDKMTAARHVTRQCWNVGRLTDCPG